MRRTCGADLDELGEGTADAQAGGAPLASSVDLGVVGSRVSRTRRRAAGSASRGGMVVGRFETDQDHRLAVGRRPGLGATRGLERRHQRDVVARALALLGKRNLSAKLLPDISERCARSSHCIFFRRAQDGLELKAWDSSSSIYAAAGGGLHSILNQDTLP